MGVSVAPGRTLDFPMTDNMWYQVEECFLTEGGVQPSTREAQTDVQRTRLGEERWWVKGGQKGLLN